MAKALRALAVVAALQLSDAFLAIPTARPAERSGVVMMGGRKATPLGRTSTAAGKKLVVEQVKGKLENADLIFSVAAGKITVKQISALRNAIPATCKATIVKNSLMTRACDTADWNAMTTQADLNAGSNLWFFVPQDDMRPVLEAYTKWVKENKLEEAVIKGGVFETAIQDGPGVKALQKLPTKLELIQKIAVSLKLAGAQGIAVRLKKAAGGQLVNAISMVYNDEEKRDAEGGVIKAEVVAE